MQKQEERDEKLEALQLLLLLREERFRGPEQGQQLGRIGKETDISVPR